MNRKNYSFYMLDDFGTALETIQAKDDRIKALSKSQAVYFIVSEIAQTGKYTNTQDK